MTKSLPELIRLCINQPKLSHLQPKTSTEHAAADAFTDTVIQSLILLGPKHPTLLRPHVAQIQAYLKPWVIAHGLDVLQGEIPKPLEICENARQLSIIVLACTPRTAASQAWTTAVEELLLYLHRTADIVFRSLEEIWEANGAVSTGRPARLTHNNSDLIPSDPEPGPFNLPSWIGIEGGVDRLLVLLSFVQVFINTRTAVPVEIPVNDFYDALDRMLLASPHHVSPKTGCSKYERDTLAMSLQGIHVATLKIHYRLVSVFGHDDLYMIYSIIGRVNSIWQQVGQFGNIRGVCYMLLAKILSLAGKSLTVQEVGGLSLIFRACCHDINNFRVEHGLASPSNVHEPSVVDRTTEVTPTVYAMASQFLRAILKHLSIKQFKGADAHTRTLLTRTAILSRDEEAMLSLAIGQPGINGSIHVSILPLLARSTPQSSAVEALIRPQMPTIMQSVETGPGGIFTTAPSVLPTTRAEFVNIAPRPANEGQKRAFNDAFGVAGSDMQGLLTPIQLSDSPSPLEAEQEYPMSKKAKAQKTRGPEKTAPRKTSASNQNVSSKKTTAFNKTISLEEENELVDVFSGVELPDDGDLSAAFQTQHQDDDVAKVREKSGAVSTQKKQDLGGLRSVAAGGDDDSDEEIPMLDMRSSSEIDGEVDDTDEDDFQVEG